MTKLVWLAFAGIGGTLARYGLSGLVQRTLGAQFPWGTLFVNVTGCFVFGLFWSLAENRLTISGEIRTVVLIGFLGAFTTFSSFAFETGQLLRDGQWLTALLNLSAQNLLGILMLFVGQNIGRLL